MPSLVHIVKGTRARARICVCVCVCVQGHCREFKVVQNSGNASIFSVEGSTGAVILDNNVGRDLTQSFVVFDVVANCSASVTQELSSAIRTQVATSVFAWYF